MCATLNAAILGSTVRARSDSRLYFRVAGVSFGTARQEAVGSAFKHEKAILVAEPQNEHDPGAVAVFDLGGRQMGYMPR